MTKKIQIILGIVSILGALATAAFAYANAVYFPMERGIVIEQKLASLPDKLDKIITLLEKK
jgi:hypothetical protein